MNILAIDTATAVLAVGVSSNDGMRYIESDAGLTHSEALMGMVDNLMNIAGLAKKELELIACMRGPGSFTGLRIGFAAAKGLALALGIPVVSVPTLDCMAARFSFWPGLVIPVIDARKHCFFAALYRGRERISPYMDAAAPAIAEAVTEALAKTGVDLSDAGLSNTTRANADWSAGVLLTGPDASMLLPELKELGHYAVALDPGGKTGKIRDLLAISREYYIFKKVDETSSGPLYLRKSDAELTHKANSWFL
jgi:tRNA threonylcarbamoyladenosine biosynthesis protein TsaB